MNVGLSMGVIAQRSEDEPSSERENLTKAWVLVCVPVVGVLLALLVAWRSPSRLYQEAIAVFAGIPSLICISSSFRLRAPGRRKRMQLVAATAGLWIALVAIPAPWLIQFESKRLQFTDLANQVLSGRKFSEGEPVPYGVHWATLSPAGHPVIYLTGNQCLHYLKSRPPIVNSNFYDEILPIDADWTWTMED